MFKTALKLIFRNWWRNKTFTLISIVSLTVGIACTALLISFVSYEYGIEKNNPNRDKLVWILQDNPNKPGEKAHHIKKDIAEQLKQKYPDVEDFLQFNSPFLKYAEVNNIKFDAPRIWNVNASFPSFFPFELLYGTWDALQNPTSLIISEKLAQLYFGNENALGKEIIVSEVFGGTSAFTVGGIVKNRAQSAIEFEAIFCNPAKEKVGTTLLKTSRKIDLHSFEQKVKADNISTTEEQLHFYSFDDALSAAYSKHNFYWHSRKDTLLLIGLISAILVFLIAVFNYVNMSFSRVLQQVKTLHTEKLMGAKPSDVRLQIFLDTSITVFISFVLAMLMMHDLLPAFNQIVDVKFTPSYFYSSDFFPLLILFAVLLTIIPAWIMGRKISRLSGTDYRMFFVTKKNRWIASMVTIQFVIAFILIIATITANNQAGLAKKNIERYKNVIEVGTPFARTSVVPIESRLKSIPGIESYAFTNGGIYTVHITQNTFRNNSEGLPTEILLISGSEGLTKTLKLNQISGVEWDNANEKYPNPVFVNKTFADAAQVLPSEIIGNPLFSYIDDKDSAGVIAGVVEDFNISSLEKKAIPTLIRYIDKTKRHSNIYIRTKNGEAKNVIKALRQAWYLTFPEEFFAYGETYDMFVNNNKKIFEMSRLLKMYSLISILLTCFGLFGITFYAVRQRTKEIGIRKINGAKTPQLLWLLMKPMFVWIGIGFAIAAPLAWWLMERWLQQFVYRVDMSVLSFLLAFLAVTAITFATVGWHVWRTAQSNPVKSLKSE